MKKSMMIILMGIVLSSQIACNKNKQEPDPNRTASDIFGKVKLFDEFQVELEKEGMVVSIVGSDPLIGDTTDADGNYRLKNIPFGNFKLLFEKEGYGDFIIFLNHVNNVEGFTEIETLFLGEKSKTKVPHLNLDLGPTSVTIQVTVDSLGTVERPRYYRIFYSKDNTVSNSNYEQVSSKLIGTDEVNETHLSVGALHEMGFKTGDIVFVKAYGESFYTNAYFDLERGYGVYPNLNSVSAPEKSFEVK